MRRRGLVLAAVLVASGSLAQTAPPAADLPWWPLPDGWPRPDWSQPPAVRPPADFRWLVDPGRQWLDLLPMTRPRTGPPAALLSRTFSEHAGRSAIGRAEETLPDAVAVGPEGPPPRPAGAFSHSAWGWTPLADPRSHMDVVAQFGFASSAHDLATARLLERAGEANRARDAGAITQDQLDAWAALEALQAADAGRTGLVFAILDLFGISPQLRVSLDIRTDPEGAVLVVRRGPMPQVRSNNTYDIRASVLQEPTLQRPGWAPCALHVPGQAEIRRVVRPGGAEVFAVSCAMRPLPPDTPQRR